MGQSNAALRAGYAVFVAVALAGCGGGGGDQGSTTALAVEVDAQGCDPALGGCGAEGDRRGRPDGSKACDKMVGLTVAAKEIDLPTRGAAVTAASIVAAAGTGASAIPEHCLVSGKISPIDPTAPDILFRVALPTDWNAKVVMFGGGGFDGSIPNVAGNVPVGPTDQLRPLGRGYATFASDSGHQAGALGSQDGTFMLNDEALRNWGGEALKKTRDAAVQLIKARYGKPIRKAYFAGGSTGGREAIQSITRWPDDWDGAIVAYPAWNQASAMLGGHRVNRALAQPGAYPSVPKRALLLKASLQACDGLDGVVDGLISDQLHCNAVFDPATASVDGSPLRCPDGVDTGDTCLSDVQIATFKVVNTDAHFNFTLASGEDHYPGYNIWGADLGITSNPAPIQPTVTFLAFGTSQPMIPMPRTAPYISVQVDQGIQYGITRIPGYDSLSVDPENPGPWGPRFSELSAMIDQPVDLDAFAAKGGKLLLVHGLTDILVSSRATEEYYQRLQARMGHGEVDKFVRYYEVPGLGHAVSSIFNAAWDSLTTLEKWVEQGKAPGPQVVADTVGVAGRTRPLCEYPKWAQYNGSGDVNAAASFTCVTHAAVPPTQRQTAYGTVVGTDLSATSGTYAWKGVPYAKAPAGELRWKPPVDPAPWTTPKYTQQFGNACAQNGRLYGPGLNNKYDATIGATLGQPVGSEDCLYLNIWRPSGAATNLPVIVWVHGGSNITGYTADPLYDGANLARTANAVVVSVNYRLGMFGFLNSSVLKNGESLNDSGDFAILDIIKALKFVNGNIANFGGNPGNVTLMGESAGAVNVYAAMTSPLVVNASPALIHRAIPISGGISLASELPAGSIAALAPASAFAGQGGLLIVYMVIKDGLATDIPSAQTYLATQTTEQIAAYMRGKSADFILSTVLTYLAPLGASGSGPIPDGHVVPVSPINAIKAGQYTKVPVLIGNTRDEGKLFPTLFPLGGGAGSGRLLTDAQVFSIAFNYNPEAPPQTTLEQWIPPAYLPVTTPTTGFNAVADKVNQIFFGIGREKVAEALTTQQSNVWAYRFDWDELPAPFNDIFGAAHSFDLAFAFGNFAPSLYSNISYTTANRPGRVALSDAMMRSIGAFARTGDPNNVALGVTWPAWPSTLRFDATPTAKAISVQ
ncbi:MAG TPA: tannase/feruloyl esterase family alpha/beta hydrolase [Burkholderiaceae bacterium]|nr:tannase/feruloyl esterase family alpha/beta hydrolase [Burkholderiaceae bacterium]